MGPSPMTDVLNKWGERDREKEREGGRCRGCTQRKDQVRMAKPATCRPRREAQGKRAEL